MLKWSKRVWAGMQDMPASHYLCADLPGWGEASIRSHYRRPGELFLTCDSLGIEMRPLGQITWEDAPKAAEAELERVVRQFAAWCEEALAALHDGA